jgi:sulfatase maturation enzyme AslB (radical SAM superfamily)
VRPQKFVMSFFGGEPLLNLPVMYYLAERCHAMCEERGIPQLVNVITNGLPPDPRCCATADCPTA